MKTSFLPRRYLYIELLLYSLISTLMIVAWIPAIISLISYGTVFKSALRAAGFLNFTAITLLVFIRFIKRELRTVRYRLTGEYLGFQTASRGKKISISSISSVVLLRFPLGGGIAVIESPEGSLNIPLLISDSTGFFSQLRDYLKVTASPAAEQTDWETILRVCRITGITDRRSQKMFSPLLSTSVAALPIGMVTGAVYWDMPVVPLMLWGIAGTLFPLATYTIADVILRLNASRIGTVSVTDSFAEYENRTLLRIGIAGGLLYLLCGILYRTIIP